MSIVDSSSNPGAPDRGGNKVQLLAQGRNPFPLTGILEPLIHSSQSGPAGQMVGPDYMGGVTFPFTPTMQIGHQANYGTYDATHTAYSPNYYINTPSPTISITANFASNDLEEAAYTAAAIQFFKSCTKPDYGMAAKLRATAGTPPPILVLKAYGRNTLHAESTPVIIRSFNYTMQEDVNYVEGDFGVLPTMLVMSLELSVQLSPNRVRKQFDLHKFANGGLMGGFM